MAEALTYARLSTKPCGSGGKMIKHIVMVKFKPEVSQEQQAEFAKKVPEVLANIPGAKNITLGLALAVEGEPRHDGATFMDFDDEAQLKAYLDHPMHQAIDAQGRAMCSDYLIMNFVY
jgi:uncharacterized protein (DUF1330 family)